MGTVGGQRRRHPGTPSRAPREEKRGERVSIATMSRAVEGRGCELSHLPPCSPDYDPIEEACSKVKSKVKALLRKVGARTREALVEAIGAAFSAMTARDARRSFFEHCGYGLLVQLPRKTLSGE